MTSIVATPQKLDFGSVVQLTFGGLRQSFGRLLPLIGLLIVLPSAFTLISSQSQGGVMARGYVLSPLYFANLIVGQVGWIVFHAAGLQVLFGGMTGTPIDLRTCLRRSVGHILPLLAIFVLYFLAVWFGAILLVVPGVMLAVAFSMVAPARVLEGAGVLQAFGRSRSLTRGNRWRITGLLLIYMVSAIVLEVAIISAAGGLSGTANLSRVGAIGLTIALQIFGLIFGLVGLSGVCGLYVELSRMVGGMGSEDVAQVFD